MTRLARAYAASVVFALAFLATSLSGATTFTALIRGAITATATYVLTGLLIRPVVSVVLDALARDRVAAASKKEKVE